MRALGGRESAGIGAAGCGPARGHGGWWISGRRPVCRPMRRAISAAAARLASLRGPLWPRGTVVGPLRAPQLTQLAGDEVAERPSEPDLLGRRLPVVPAARGTRASPAAVAAAVAVFPPPLLLAPTPQRSFDPVLAVGGRIFQHMRIQTRRYSITPRCRYRGPRSGRAYVRVAIRAAYRTPAYGYQRKPTPPRPAVRSGSGWWVLTAGHAPEKGFVETLM